METSRVRPELVDADNTSSWRGSDLDLDPRSSLRPDDRPRCNPAGMLPLPPFPEGGLGV
eukprot:CAMPEP_0178611500 /NCGR_PEP_ID=MMETSP0698-20121128/640_1 /TAXON_ID=265572 /ORGANISM="Extubocellulus spinifer, Strain CCMP396" /LENGTH=58 /DNA_ID=CAMNT_0020250125 /DNA_START=110 /DNA_END=286 /DNA_ORIENTATION=+